VIQAAAICVGAIDVGTIHVGVTDVR